IDATLVWNEHVTYHDNGTLGVLDPADTFTAGPHDTLNLYLYRDGTQVAASTSSVDDLQYIHFLVTNPGQYELLVTRPSAIGGNRTYSVAWNSTAVPEPGTLALFSAGAAVLILFGRRGRQFAGTR